MRRTRVDSVAALRAFSRAAPVYDDYAVLQRELSSRLMDRLDFSRYDPRDVLDLGCATGFSSRALTRKFPQASVAALDWSKPMLARLGETPVEGLHALCADMHALPLATASMDLVFSNLAITWGRDVPAVFGELRRVMRPGAMLLFTCFGPDTLQELKSAWRAVDASPRVYEFPDMHDIGDELVSAGFREPVMDMERVVLDYPDVMSMLRDLRWTGQVNTVADRPRGLLGKARFGRMKQSYERFCNDRRYPASFEVIYGAAFAPEEGQPVRTPEGDVATFSVESLRAKPLKRGT